MRIVPATRKLVSDWKRYLVQQIPAEITFDAATATHLGVLPEFTAAYCEIVEEEGVFGPFAANEKVEFKVGAATHDIAKGKRKDQKSSDPRSWYHTFWRILLPTPLTAQDRMVTHRHPLDGGNYLREIGAPPIVYWFAERHHLRPDAKGYPHYFTWGEAPKGISKAAAEVVKSFATLDVFQALRGDRPYRPFRTKLYNGSPIGRRLFPHEVKNILLEGRGTLFYDAAVDRLLRHWDYFIPLSDKLDDFYTRTVMALPKSESVYCVRGHLRKTMTRREAWQEVYFPSLPYAPVTYRTLAEYMSYAEKITQDELYRYRDSRVRSRSRTVAA